MTFEARLAFIIFFFAIWCFLGLIPWAVAAVIVRGRNALFALPLALTGAAASGVLVPLIGLRDATGFFVSLPVAAIGGALGSAAGIAVARRLNPVQSSRDDATPNSPPRDADHQG
jgi:hypothetical protein